MFLLLITLLVYIAAGAVIFIYHKLSRLSYFWSTVGMIIFFAYTCHNFGVKWTTISLLYLSVCVVTFILRALSSPGTRSADDYKTIYSALLGGNNPARMWSGGFSYNKYRGFSNSQFNSGAEEAQQNEPLKFNKSFLCASVPAFTPIISEWLMYFLSKKAFNNSFRIGSSFYVEAFRMKNKIIMILKNRKAA